MDAARGSHTPEIETTAGPTGASMAAIRAASDADGCGCLDCLGVGTVTLRRGFLGTVLWASRLCRAYPAVPALALVLALAGALVETVGPAYLPDPVVGGVGVVASVGLAVGLRAVVASIAARELTDRDIGPLAALWSSLGSLVVLLGLFWFLLMVALFVPFSLGTVLAIVFVVADINPVDLLGFHVVAAGSLVLVLGPLAVLVFKTWYAIEACVLGGYDPVKSLVVSWRVTTDHRGRALGIVVGTLGSSGVAAAIDPVVGAGAPLAAPGPVVTATLGAVGQATVVVWFGVYAHSYVQGVLAG
jgi:hypothetical protein